MKLLLLSVPLLLAAGPCTDAQEPAAGRLWGEGTVHQGVAPECPNTWNVTTANGDVLWPVSDPAFQQEGLQVRFTAQRRTDVASICMAGTIVDFLTIEKR